MHYLISRSFTAFSKMCSGLAVELDGVAGYSAMNSTLITHRTLSLIFEATDIIAFWVKAGALCTNSSSYPIFCPLPSPASLSVRLKFSKVS